MGLNAIIEAPPAEVKVRVTPSELLPKWTLMVYVSNAEDFVEPLYVFFRERFDRAFHDFEIVFLNNASSDRSGERIDRLCLEDQRVRGIHFSAPVSRRKAFRRFEAFGEGTLRVDAKLWREWDDIADRIVPEIPPFQVA